MLDQSTCPGCIAAEAGKDRLQQTHGAACPQFDAFYDATDGQLAAMIPPFPATRTWEAAS